MVWTFNSGHTPRHNSGVVERVMGRLYSFVFPIAQTLIRFLRILHEGTGDADKLLIVLMNAIYPPAKNQGYQFHNTTTDRICNVFGDRVSLDYNDV